MVRVAAVAALVACQPKKPPPQGLGGDAGAATKVARVTTPEPLPPPAPTAPIGEAGPQKLVVVDDAGAWQVTCHGEPYRSDDDDHLDVVVGGGEGLRADALLAAAPSDLVIVTGEDAAVIDVVARTITRVTATAAAIDPKTRRVVLAAHGELVVRDPGRAPRTIRAAGSIASLSLRGARWAVVSFGDEPARQTGCDDLRYPYPRSELTVIDLDPAGVEEVDTVGPEIGVTASGEITLRGEVVVPADCVGEVVGALAEPPRVLVQCRDGSVALGAPGVAARAVGHTSSTQTEGARIAENLVLGQRVNCLWGGCADLVDGTWYATFSEPLVVFTERRIVRKIPSGLLVDDLDTDVQTKIVLPQITQAVTVDTVTGKRKTGAPPPAALEAIDLADGFLLYGRFVVDLGAAKVTRTLDADAVAVDATGRALTPASPGTGPFHWVGP